MNLAQVSDMHLIVKLLQPLSVISTLSEAPFLTCFCLIDAIDQSCCGQKVHDNILDLQIPVLWILTIFVRRLAHTYNTICIFVSIYYHLIPVK